MIDSVVINRDTGSLDDLPRAETVKCLFDMSAGDDREMHKPQSAAHCLPRMPGSYILI